jgi:hypothetical protein
MPGFAARQAGISMKQEVPGYKSFSCAAGWKKILTCFQLSLR